jgi:hypothetical protein
LMALRREGVAILRLDHTGKDAERGERGSSAKRTDIDVSYLLARADGDVVTLRRMKNRSHVDGPEVLALRRETDPLRHVLAEVDLAMERRVGAVIAALHRLGVPLDAGRPTCRARLREAGEKCTTSDLAKAITRRRGPFSDGDAAVPPYRGGDIRTGPGELGSDRFGQVSDSNRTGFGQSTGQGQFDCCPTDLRTHTGPCYVPPTTSLDVVGDCDKCGQPMSYEDPTRPGLHPGC